jgi:integrase
MKAPSPATLAQAAEEWLRGVKDGTVCNRSGDPYKPSAIRSYERALRLRVLPALGQVRLTSVQRNDVKDLADRLLAEGLTPSTVKNTLNSLQAIYRRARSSVRKPLYQGETCAFRIPVAVLSGHGASRLVGLPTPC